MDVAMSKPSRVSNKESQHLSLRKLAAGFTLVELMVAMAVFLIVGGAAVALARGHMLLFNTAQNQTVLNITLRNAVAQLQMEVVNAGTGYAAAGAVAFSPMGATIGKAANANCKATAIYGSACFDTLTLISADNSLPALAPSSDILGTVAINTTSTVMYLTLPGNPAGATTAQYTTWASSLKAGTELIFVQGGTDVGLAGQPSIAIIVLRNDAAQTGNAIQLTTTGATTTITKLSGNCAGALTDINGIPPGPDPLSLYDIGECLRFTGTFNPQLDYVVKLVAGVTYSVDATNAANPKLVRKTPPAIPGNPPISDIIAEQIIGFTVGAWSSNKAGGAGYTLDPSDYKSDWASIRSLQIHLVARAAPNSDNPSSFRNAYDQGAYQVQGMSVVINPRNLNTN
jgi:prepilin-type N-terminal cleavage/methylation domain-containing protein